MYLSLLFPLLKLDMQDCVTPTIQRLNTGKTGRKLVPAKSCGCPPAVYYCWPQNLNFFTVCIYIQLRSWAFQCVYLVFLRLFSQILKLWNSRNRESIFFKQSCEKDLKRKKEKSQTKTRTLSFLASVYINWTRQKHETTWRWIWRKVEQLWRPSDGFARMQHRAD